MQLKNEQTDALNPTSSVPSSMSDCIGTRNDTAEEVAHNSHSNSLDSKMKAGPIGKANSVNVNNSVNNVNFSGPVDANWTRPPSSVGGSNNSSFSSDDKLGNLGQHKISVGDVNGCNSSGVGVSYNNSDNMSNSLMSVCRDALKSLGCHEALVAFENEVKKKEVLCRVELDGDPNWDDSRSFDLSITALENPSSDYLLFTYIYKKFSGWVHNSLEEHKPYLLEVLLVVFTDLWLKLFGRSPPQAAMFLREFCSDHEPTHSWILGQLKGLTHRSLMKECGAIQYLLKGEPVQLKMPKLSYTLLMTHLVATRSTILLDIIQSRIFIKVTASKAQTCKEIVSAWPVNRYQAASAINESTVLWGLRSEDIPYEELRELEMMPSEAFPKTPEGFAKRFDGEPTEMVDFNKLPSIFPDPTGWKGQVWRQTAFRNYRKRAEVSPFQLPSILLYNWYTKDEITSVEVSQSDGDFVACGCGDNTIRISSLLEYESSKMDGKHTTNNRTTDDNCGDVNMAVEEFTVGGASEADHDVVAGDTKHDSSDDKALGMSDGKGYQAILRGHSGPVYAMSLSSCNRFLLSGGIDTTVRLWSTSQRSGLAAYDSHRGSIWSVDFAPHNQYFVTASADGTALFWSLERSYMLRIFADRGADSNVAKFSPNGGYIGTGSLDASIRLWDIRSAECCRLFLGHKTGVTSLAFSHNGRLMATGDESGNVIVWDIPTARNVATLKNHKEQVTSLSFSHGSRILASSSSDTSITLWDIFDLATAESSALTSSRLLIPSTQQQQHPLLNPPHIIPSYGGGPNNPPHYSQTTASATLNPYSQPSGNRFYGPVGARNNSMYTGFTSHSSLDQQQQPNNNNRLCRQYKAKHAKIFKMCFTPRNVLLACGVTPVPSL